MLKTGLPTGRYHTQYFCSGRLLFIIYSSVTQCVCSLPKYVHSIHWMMFRHWTNRVTQGNNCSSQGLSTQLGLGFVRKRVATINLGVIQDKSSPGQLYDHPSIRLKLLFHPGLADEKKLRVIFIFLETRKQFDNDSAKKWKNDQVPWESQFLLKVKLRFAIT